MAELDFPTEFLAHFKLPATGAEVCGFITKKAEIFPLGSDTKVLSTVFELITRPAIYEIAAKHSLQVFEPVSQNHYPDFTLMTDTADKMKIAIDVKTTYRTSPKSTFGFTLGSYTSFIREASHAKNICFPYGEYSQHWIIGFVYTRVATKKSGQQRIFKIDEIAQIAAPYSDVEFFVQEKWKVSSHRAGSGNTANIGSIEGTLADFKGGAGKFQDEAEFLAYWRDYENAKAKRVGKYSNLEEFREWRKNQS